MKLITFTTVPSGPERGERLGVLLGDGTALDLLDCHAASGAPGEPPPATMLELLASWDERLPQVRELVDQAAAVPSAVLAPGSFGLLAPVPRPPRLRDYLTYEAHASGSGLAVTPAFEQMPVCYKGNPHTVVAPDSELLWPAYSAQLDFELEIGFYVAGTGVDLTVEAAERHIAGVTLFNDVTARDIQLVEMSMMIGPSKSKDFCNAMGPCLVTMDEVDEYAIELVARVNGEEWSRGTSAGRRYSFAEVLAWASWAEPIVPGEFLAVGTVGGGCGLELDRWVQPGDVIELEGSGIGVLRNTVGPRQERKPGTGLDSYQGSPWFGPRAPETTGADA